MYCRPRNALQRNLAIVLASRIGAIGERIEELHDRNEFRAIPHGEEAFEVQPNERWHERGVTRVEPDHAPNGAVYAFVRGHPRRLRALSPDVCEQRAVVVPRVIKERTSLELTKLPYVFDQQVFRDRPLEELKSRRNLDERFEFLVLALVN